MKKALLLLSWLPATAFGDPYAIFHAQGIAGRHNLDDSQSLMINIGIGYEIKGFYIDWDAGINAAAPFQDIFTIDDNQQKLQMAITTGYFLKLSGNHFLRFGAGSKATIFDENCYAYAYETICERKEEYGPTYKLGYFHRAVGKGFMGLELSSDELSNARKYGALSFTINSYF